MKHTRETEGWKLNGFLMLAVVVGLWALSVFLIVNAARHNDPSFPGPLWLGLGLSIVAFVMSLGFFTNQPNAARVLVFLGEYVGTVRDQGFWWTNPLASRRLLSLRLRNFNSERLKVNDAHGNPVEIAAVIVWQVVDTARAMFDVDNYLTFVNIQSETAVRGLASHFPYDGDDKTLSLRGSPEEVSEHLQKQVQARLQSAGLEVSEARISHLAYAPEVAQAMLRRQQAQAIIEARQKIVEGAVGMVEHALRMLTDMGVVTLDEERKASMVNNLLVALVSEHEAHPVINAGNLYA